MTGTTHGFVEQIPMPDVLQECYKYQTKNIDYTEKPSQEINMLCITKYLYQTAHLRPQRQVTNQTIAYVGELMRKVISKHEKKGHRSKRQGFPGASIMGVRREIRTLSRREWETFVFRLNQLQQPILTPGQPPFVPYYAIAEMHLPPAIIQAAHNGPSFLGWHRIYLLLLEEALGMPIPYWDSRLDFRMPQPTDSVIWTPEFFGEGFGSVASGPFGGWPRIPTPDRVPLVRNIGNDGSLVSDSAVNAIMSAYSHFDVSEPAPLPQMTFEAIHNAVHVWIDGQMSGISTSPQDPIFFMHHAFIDYLWSMFRNILRNSGVNPENDYPRKGNRMHAPLSQMIPFSLLNIQGFRNDIESPYAPSPTCPECGGSPYLQCVPPGYCVSVRGFAPGFTSTPGARGSRPVPVRERFETGLRDPRTRGDASMTTIPVRRRRSVQETTNTTTHFSNDASQMNNPYQNTFVIDGISDVSKWSFVPVRIIFERPPEAKFESFIMKDGKLVNSTDMFSPAKYNTFKVEIKQKVPATYSKCHISGSGASKVFVQTDGIDYSGRYKDYAVVDERLPISSSMAYVGVKKPENGAAKFYMTAYDSCGRVCTPRCLVNGRYQECSGAFQISTAFPKMYGRTYEEAVQTVWTIGDQLLAEAHGAEIPIAFICKIKKQWPWRS
ncbi:tyrosinase-like protein 1 [Pecten maximus]|uniref:tyrosinase-like protein 1 n=1 Tax=Pecten maximus TaxID=6579 RepID=UPI001458D328|nr:tyrosinase-like protein 1 [Pecten maximus]